MTPQHNRAIQRFSMVGRFDVPAGISRQVTEEFGMKVSRQTVSRRLQEERFRSRSPAVKLLVRQKNEKVKLDFAKNFFWAAENRATIKISLIWLVLIPSKILDCIKFSACFPKLCKKQLNSEMGASWSGGCSLGLVLALPRYHFLYYK